MTSRSWRDVRKDAENAGLIDEKNVQRHRTRLESATRAYRLAEIRRERDMTQDGVATALGISQSRVSRLERGDVDHTELSTLKAYVEALGGELRVIAAFGDEHLRVG